MRLFSYSRGAPLTRGLQAAFALPLILLLLSGIAGAAALNLATRQVNTLTRQEEPLEANNALGLLSLVRAQAAARGFSLSADPDFLPVFERNRQQTFVALDEARRLASSETISGKLEEQRALAEVYFRDYGSVGIANRQAGLPSDPERVVQARELVERFSAQNEETRRLIEVRRNARRERVERLGRETTIGFIVLLLAGLGLGLLAATRTARAITGPLAHLQATLTEFAQGNLTARAKPEGPAELRAYAERTNELATAAEQLAIAEREQVERQERVVEISRRVHHHLELQPLLDTTASEVGQALGAERVLVRLIDEGGAVPVRAEYTVPGVPPVGLAASTPSRQELQGLVEGAATFAVDDVDDAPGLDPKLCHDLCEMGSQASLFAPLSVGGSIVGLLCIHQVSAPRQWSHGDTELAEAVGREVVSAISHAQAYQRERDLVVKLRELDRTKTDFVSSVSHELRTPLTSIVGYLEMLDEGDAGELAPMQRQMLGVVERNSRRLLALIEDLLTLSRVESGAFKVTLAPTDVGALVGAVREAVAPSVTSRLLHLEVDVPTDLPPVLGDAAQLERVLLNLMTNAVKFTPLDGTVRLRAHAEGAQVVIEVEDTGIGIPEEEQPKMFSRFFRTSIAQDQAIQGTGLGLVIVKSIVEHHNGSITFRSKPGEGTTFVVTLPAVPDHVPERPSGTADVPVHAGVG